ncbi:inactive peptidyl-prolyl cis-trans isomerase FKBP6 [Anthonomus grandis grandis]|uniref:inactive peptidyl-prolyl cis-trans isomerase FKBP6 n=1 Tax=Anthonomus grandis grandis TaxID=2921223 RepID=UPI0021664ED7|nr:inactive peptidyl-prolyl cis-trans isomerase FKBP6 [Anthonomus grandis grandis]
MDELESKMAKVNFEELLSTGTILETDSSDVKADDSGNEEVTNEEYDEEVLKHLNTNCIGEFEDEGIYDSSEPFSYLQKQMEDLFGNESIMKKVLRQGYGNKPEKFSVVKVHYNGYTELEAKPFDCTYARKKPHVFTMGNGEVLPGLELAVQSMLLNEKSQFLIKPELAYGKFGCLGRIPPNATVLFQIELLEIIESVSAENFDNLPEKKQQEFSEIYNFCVAQSEKGKNLFVRDNVSAAIKQYNIAVSKLEYAQLANYEEQTKQQELLHKLYQNLLVCHTKLQEPKKGCINFNKLFHLTKGTELKINAKIYYNHAKCLRLLGEFKRAKESLQKARNIEPRNPYVLNEFKIIDEEQRKYQEKEKKMAAAMVKSKD